MEALQIELYFSLVIIFATIGIGIFYYKWITKKMKEDGGK